MGKAVHKEGQTKKFGTSAVSGESPESWYQVHYHKFPRLEQRGAQACGADVFHSFPTAINFKDDQWTLIKILPEERDLQKKRNKTTTCAPL